MEDQDLKYCCVPRMRASKAFTIDEYNNLVCTVNRWINDDAYATGNTSKYGNKTAIKLGEFNHTDGGVEDYIEIPEFFFNSHFILHIEISKMKVNKPGSNNNVAVVFKKEDKSTTIGDPIYTYASTSDNVQVAQQDRYCIINNNEIKYLKIYMAATTVMKYDDESSDPTIKVYICEPKAFQPEVTT